MHFAQTVTGSSGWSANDWSALGTMITAGIALVAAVAAFWQVREARKLRAEQAQPYVAVYMEPSSAAWRIVELVIKNFGMTAAHDVSVQFDPPLRRTVANGGEEVVWFPERIPCLVPGQEWRTVWDSGLRRFAGDLPKRYEAKVTYCRSGARAPCEPAVFVLDWNAHEGRRVVETFGSHDSAKALREIQRTLERWSEFGGGLNVYARNGDRKDQRSDDYLTGREDDQHDAERE